MYAETHCRTEHAFGIWRDGELLDGSLCSKCLELHGVHAPCTPPKPLPADAVSLPPRSIKSGITGALSLHDYRKYLSQSAECVSDPVDRSEKTLKRKMATLNLNRSPAHTSVRSSAVSVSSAASSPPPLSPSYSHSIISYQSEQEPELAEASFVTLPPSQGPRVHLVSENATRPRPNRKRLNTFREKLQQNTIQAQSETQQSSSLSRHQASGPMLANTQAVATISHGGTSFEILNPRKSLDVARIVSYIEDVDSCSVMSMDPHRESIVSTNPYSLTDSGLDRVSLSQFTDASLPSHYSTPSLYTTSISTGCSTPKRQTADIPSSSPGVHDRVRSLSDYSLHDHDYWAQDRQVETDIHDNQNYYDLVGDPPIERMASISERLEETEQEPDLDHPEPQVAQSPQPSSFSQPTFYSEGSDIGEPGSPVYANGEWARVDERDRGIFLELPHHHPPPRHPHHPMTPTTPTLCLPATRSTSTPMTPSILILMSTEVWKLGVALGLERWGWAFAEERSKATVSPEEEAAEVFQLALWELKRSSTTCFLFCAFVMM
ncbi:hypothetical protein N7462_008077 [Penicillium macrosclerotiorum]|uniref:uncharacterized protein n=1 Tax=Penicillium macrosclerotiorum TaxID=303699 RepID=UPI002547B478|nr:uncharacterized protein N7462_008077 [Penicillium macrosclerotiorum]KAJ5679833.1 hypothetical protein N7462_008077 [Penicillium macrosclerotiorum]